MHRQPGCKVGIQIQIFVGKGYFEGLFSNLHNPEGLFPIMNWSKNEYQLGQRSDSCNVLEYFSNMLSPLVQVMLSAKFSLRPISTVFIKDTQMLDDLPFSDA